MNYVFFLLISAVFVSCNALPQLYEAAEEIFDDNAIQVIVSREAVQKQTDLDITINIKNK